MVGIYREIWNKRSLIYNFAVADLKIRYRNSILGFLWNFLEPLLMLGVLYIVFTNIFNSQIEHFALYILLGLILWNMFAKGTTIGLNSILSRSSILKQIYFPREITSLSSAITALIMLCFELMVFVIFMIAFQFIPPATIIFLPLVILLEFILVAGLSLPLSVLNVRYRDIQFIWTVIVQAGFFLTPIFYKFEVIPEYFRNILYFNPMVQIVNIAHDATLYNIAPTIESIELATVTTLLIFGLSYATFRKLQVRTIEEL
ncbi:MAG: ABC transporter permease [Nitrosopumilaceae archaeon]